MCEHCDEQLEKIPDGNRWTVSYWHLNDEGATCADGPHTIDDIETYAPGHALLQLQSITRHTGLMFIPGTSNEDTGDDGPIDRETIDYANPDGGYAMFMGMALLPPYDLDEDDDPPPPYLSTPWLVTIHQKRRDMRTHLRTLNERLTLAELEQHL